MSDSSEASWSNGSNAPQIPYLLYITEKDYFAGFLLGSISYGIVVALFFQCMSVLLSPANPMKRGVKWGLIAHTVAMFLFLTIPAGIDLNYLSTCSINNRDFPGDDEYDPGPLGCYETLSTEAAATAFIVMFPLNQWLADGLLLHRCYVVYSMNRWVIAIPCLMYLSSIGMYSSPLQANGDTLTSITGVAVGIASVCKASGLIGTNLNTAYVSVSLSLNVLLALLIVIRLMVHIRDVRKTLGTSNGLNSLFTTTATVVTMLIESYALYAVALLLYVVPWAVDSPILGIFNGVTGAVQVIAPYLIILRVAKRRALTSQSISGTVGSLHFKSQVTATAESEGTSPDGDSMDSMEVDGESPDGHHAGAEDAIEEVPL